MADLIDRNALIKIICAACSERLLCADMGDVCYEVACINNAPKIETAPKWIPCSERLPENNQQCLIYRNFTAGNLKMTTGIYHSDTQVFIGLRHGTALKDAIAWMPLPESPKEE